MGLDATPPAGPSALDATLLRAHPHPLSPAALARAPRDVSAELYDGHACRGARSTRTGSSTVPTAAATTAARAARASMATGPMTDPTPRAPLFRQPGRTCRGDVTDALPAAAEVW